MKNKKKMTIMFIVLTLMCFYGMELSNAQQCKLTISCPQTVLKPNKEQKVYIKIGVTGFKKEGKIDRTPLNIALVLDRSGSMSGDKLEQAKKAALTAVEEMNSQDYLSLVTYSSESTVDVPAQKLEEKEAFLSRIKKIEANGSTALYDGTQQGSKEVEKNLSKKSVNRVILLSDGLANVGPNSISDLAELGKKLGNKGISVTTFGLGEGYNEDLMLQLASNSDGNHVFITKAKNMTDVFSEEFRYASLIVAQEISGKLTLSNEVELIRSLNKDVEEKGQSILFGWNQVYSAKERYFILEVSIPPQKNGTEMTLGKIKLSYMNQETKITDELSAILKVKFNSSESAQKNSIDKKIMEDCIIQVANLENERATKMRDAGNVTEARSILNSNVQYLNSNSDILKGSKRLDEAASLNSIQMDQIENDQEWSKSRKGMRAWQGTNRNQGFGGVPVK